MTLSCESAITEWTSILAIALMGGKSPIRSGIDLFDLLVFTIQIDTLANNTPMKKITPVRFASIVWASLASLSLVLSANGAPVPAPNNGDIVLPDGFAASVVADDVGKIRGIAVSPSGDVYGRLKDGGIVAMRDADGDGAAEIVEKVPSLTSGGSGIGIHDGYLYYSTSGAIFRMKLKEGELLPVGKEETVVASLADKRSHSSKMFTFDTDGKLYAEVGSPANALSTNDRGLGAKGKSKAEVDAFLSLYGGVWVFDANKLNQEQSQGHHMTTGHRHMLALAWHPVSGNLFGLQNGRDVLDVVNPDVFNSEYNATRVSEEFHILKEGSNLGWPYSFYDPIDKKRLYSPEYEGDGEKGPASGEFQDPIIGFPAHWAPMQMAYYGGEQFPEKYRSGLFVAFHGSWNRYPDQKGYNVVFIDFDKSGKPTGEWEVFADGFMGSDHIESPKDAAHRPMGVAVGPDGSLYVGDDHRGRVWRIFRSE